jgi:hypothetical protein
LDDDEDDERDEEMELFDKRMMRSLKLDPVWVGEVGEVVDGESRRKGMEKLDYWK